MTTENGIGTHGMHELHNGLLDSVRSCTIFVVRDKDAVRAASKV